MYLSFIFTIGRKLPNKQMHVQDQQYKNWINKSWNVYKVCNKDTAKKLIDVILVSFLLTLNMFYAGS